MPSRFGGLWPDLPNAADLIEGKLEIGQLTVVLSILGLVALLARWRLTLPRPLVTDVAASGLVAVGTFWFVTRSFRWS